MTSDIASPNALLDPARAVLVLMDHQPMTLFGVHSHDPQSVVNNVTALAKTAKAFDVPVIMTTVAHDGIGGGILPELQSLFPDQVPIDRTWINCWQDPALRNAVLSTGRDQLIFAGLWTEMCVSFPALHARKEGRNVYVVADACGGASVESHDRAMQRMVQAGVTPMTSQVVLGELQRDWARQDSYAAATEIASTHYGNWGQVIRFHHQLAPAVKGHTTMQIAA